MVDTGVTRDEETHEIHLQLYHIEQLEHGSSLPVRIHDTMANSLSHNGNKELSQLR